MWMMNNNEEAIAHMKSIDILKTYLDSCGENFWERVGYVFGKYILDAKKTARIEKAKF